jgi:lysozyme family protein
MASQTSVDKILWEIIRKEGGFVNHKNDRGRATKYGVTQSTLSNWIGREATIEDVKLLTKDDAFEIFYKLYYEAPNIDDLPEQIQPIITDMSVNHGPKNAIKMLQEVIKACGLTIGIDGICGPGTAKTAAELWRMIGSDMINKIVMRRLAFYDAIVKNDASQKVFLSGWRNRATSFLV